MSKNQPISSSYLRFMMGSLGVGSSKGSNIALIKLLLFVVLILIFIGFVAFSYSVDACSILPVEKISLYFALGISSVLFVGAYFVGSGTLNILYHHTIFATYSFYRKAGLAFSVSALLSLVSGSILFLYAGIMLGACGVPMFGGWGAAGIMMSGVVPAWLLVLLPVALKAVAIEDMKITRDYAVMMDLAALGRGARRAQPSLRLKVAPRQIPAVLSGLGGFAAAQIAMARGRVPQLAFVAVVGLVCLAFAVGMDQRQNGLGVALSLSVFAILAAEVLNAPELLLDPRVAMSGQSFSRTLSLALAPSGRIIVVLAVVSSVASDMPAEALAVWLGAALVIGTRYLMRLAWTGRPGAAAKEGILGAAVAVSAYLLAGPAGMLLLLAAPIWFYIAAKNRLEAR